MKVYRERTVLYSVIDRDTGERYSTSLFSTRDGAERERNRLSISHGKLVCLGIGRSCSFVLDEDVTEEDGCE